MNHQPRVAWVTGGSSGIGLAVSHSLAAAGYLTVLSARREAPLQTACAGIQKEGGRADFVVMDAAVRDQVEGASHTILARHGKIDILVNCAGFNVKQRQWRDLNPDDFDSVMTGNLSSVFYAIYAVLPSMRANGGGVIINIASMAGKMVTIGGGVAYTVAKHGVVTLTESLNMAEFKNGIRACVIAPGEVATPAHTVPQEVLNRMLQPEDVARAVRFVVEMPPHACIYEIDMSPVWNRAWA